MTYQFKKDYVEADFEGTMHRVDIEYRDPWVCAVNYATDPSLAPHISWYSYRKFYCEDGIKVEVPLYDDPATGSIWREVDVSTSGSCICGHELSYTFRMSLRRLKSEQRGTCLTATSLGRSGSTRET